MKGTVKDVMTSRPISLSSDATVVEAARRMREADIGPVVVMDGEKIRGIVTDRDIVVRCVAEGGDVRTAKVGDVCSADVTTVASDATIEEAARLMRDKALRRLPVVDRGKPVGIVTLGDLAVQADPSSALGGISAASPND